MKFFQLVPETNLDFIGKFKIFMTLSILANIAIVAGILTKGLNYGIDFTGGTTVQVKFSEPWDAERVRTLVSDIGAKEASVVSLGKESLEYLITVREHGTSTKESTLFTKLRDKVGQGKVSLLQMDVVGPKVGAELKWAAIKSLLYSIIIITIYIWFRFDFRFAPGATIAMIHDVCIAAGFYLVTGREFTITAVAALLTIAGYSVNDTIVIYDRVRELLKKGGEGLPLPPTINKALNLTLSRTLLTSTVTLISIVPIALICTGEIANFAIAMCVGIFTGTYSTIYIAAPSTIYLQRFFEAKNKRPNAPKTVPA